MLIQKNILKQRCAVWCLIFRLEMSLGKVFQWNFIAIFIHFVPLATSDGVKICESACAAFKVPTNLLRPKNLTDYFQRMDYVNIQIDLFIDSKAADSMLANFVVEDCSQKSTLVVSSSSKVRNHVPCGAKGEAAGSKVENLILVYDSASGIDLEVLKRCFGNRWNTRARVIAYVDKVDNSTTTATGILEYFWKHDLLNVALTVQSRISGLEENFIYNPFISGTLSGSRGRLEKLNSEDRMFPDKLTDLYNHTIRISVFHHYPWSILTNFTFMRTGADIEVLRALSKKLNFSVDLKTAHHYGISHTVYLPNGEQVGMIGDVLTNRSEIVLNVQSMESAMGRRVEFTYPLLQTKYCVLVPKAKVLPMMVRVALPFPMQIWLAIMAAMGVLLVYFTLMGEQNKLIRMFELLLHHNFGNIKIPKRTCNRIILISYILWAYLLASIYQANFMNELIAPRYYKDTDTLAELYDSKLPLLVGDNMVEMLNNSDIPMIKKLAERSVEHLVFDDCIDQLLSFFNVTCGVDEYISALLAKVHTKNDSTLLIHMARECLSLHWDIYVAKDGFPFLAKFNQHIQSLIEGGLYRKWVVDVASMRLGRTKDPETGKITMEHSEGLFGLLIFGLAISTVAFIAELAAFRFSTKIAGVFSRMRFERG